MFRNLTPHAVVIGDLTIMPYGQVARCSEIVQPAGFHQGIALVHKTYNDVHDLPDPEAGVLLIVSAMVRQALPYRQDLASPGDLIRDENGNITGCRNLVVNP